ncbi:MAG TPA: hypothetical protein VE685_15765 [Thermoanaerobaculia bacterium]|nr:hypothetical protein [Thermoanaerobaculia bacterium]
MSTSSRLALLLCAAALMGTAFLLTPPDAAATCGPTPFGIYCDRCANPRATPLNWGVGATCQEATNNLRSRASQDIFCGEYGPCDVTLVITGACWWNDMKGMYQVDGYLTYRCKVCPTCL